MTRLAIRRLSAGVAASAVAFAGLVVPAAQAAPDGCTDCRQPAPKTKTVGGKTYDLVFDEGFNGTSLAETQFEADSTVALNGTMLYENKELPREDPQSNISVGDGFLRLQANQIPAKPHPNRNDLTIVTESGAITTKETAAWKYGHFEARMRFPDSPGVWPAGWMMPENSVYGWPRDGEIDWIEYPSSASQGKQNQTVLHTASTGSDRGLNDSAVTGFYTHGSSLGGKWFTWSMDWDETGYKFYVDGTLYKTISTGSPVYKGPQSAPGDNVRWDSSWVRQHNGTTHERFTEMEPFDKKFYMILNLATRIHTPDHTGKILWAYSKYDDVNWENLKFDVDYFRVYQTAEQQKQQDSVFLRFDTFGEGQLPAAEAKRDVKRGELAGKLPTPTAPAGRYFAGWYGASWYNGGEKVQNYARPITPKTPISVDTIAIAKWVDEATLTWDASPHGGVETQTTGVGEALNLKDHVPQADGYVFKGWFTDKALTTPAADPYVVTGNATLYAKWEKAPIGNVTITFDTLGVGRAPVPVQVEPGSEVTLPTLEADGYEFKGWFTDKALQNPVPTPFKPTENTTLYAKWEAVQQPPAPTPVTGVDRTGGKNRYQTSIEFSAANFPDGAETVYLASGQAYPDALAASAIAANMNAPVLLAEAGKLPEEVGAELQRLAPNRIVIVGGEGAVSEAVKLRAQTYVPTANVTRHPGADRFVTASMLAQNSYSTNVPVVFVANGLDFPDALTASAAAGSQAGPVLLTLRDELPESTVAALQKLAPKRVVLVGGDGVISAPLAGQIQQVIGKSKLERLGGQNRFETSKLVADHEFAPESQHAVVANAFDYPDALVGAAVAGMNDSPVLLTQPDVLSTATEAALKTLKPVRVSVAGGEAVVNEQVRRQIAHVTGLSLR